MPFPVLAPGEVRVAPSLLSADFGSLAEAIGEVATATSWMHVDVMDGHFVPNLTIGPPVVASLRRHTGMFLDCHLMMDNPGAYLDAFREAGADSATVHAEIGGTAELLAQLRASGMGVGLALNPDTPLEAALPHLESIDLLLLMTVFPGFGGQHFMAEVVSKIVAARREIDRRGLAVAIEVDGGIDERTAEVTARAGARVLVAGTAIFHAERPWEAARRIARAAAAAVGRAAAEAV